MISASLLAIYSLAIVGLQVLSLTVQSSGVGGAPPRTPELPALLVSGTFMVIFGGLGFAFAGVMAFGGWKMMRLESYGVALTAAILAMVAGIPCGCCPINTLVCWPIGIWAIVVLADASVKAAFIGPDTGAANTFT